MISRIRKMETGSEKNHIARSKANGEGNHIMDKCKNDNIVHDVTMNKIKTKLEKLQASVIQQMDDNLTNMVCEMMQEIERAEIPQHKLGYLLYNNAKYSNRVKASSDGKLPEKIFLPRESILTDLFQIKHFYTIYNIFVAILIILFVNIAVYDTFVRKEVNLGLSLIQWNFGGFHIFLFIWIIMMAGTVFVYSAFNYWAHRRSKFLPNTFSQKAWDYGWLCLFIAYQLLFGVCPVLQVFKFDLPPATSMALLMEQVRLIMKTHAFVRSNAPRALNFKPHSDHEEKSICPDFGHYMYFLFVPTLVYKDSYPRTQDINWRKVTWHFIEVIGVILYASFIFDRFLVPSFCNFGKEKFTLDYLIVSIFGSMMPAVLCFLCCFFGLLHSWMNAFAEMTRFADRMFYKDWWNANSYAEYYRTWNLVVHDWLYTYVFKDCCLLLKSKNRVGPTVVVFVVSAIVHEYILMFTFRFFYPMLFLAFGGFSVFLVFLMKNKTQGGNLVMWLTLCTGTGFLLSLYCMEWYSRINCPRVIDSLWDFFIPRSWFCSAIEGM